MPLPTPCLKSLFRRLSRRPFRSPRRLRANPAPSFLPNTRTQVALPLRTFPPFPGRLLPLRVKQTACRPAHRRGHRLLRRPRPRSCKAPAATFQKSLFPFKPLPFCRGRGAPQGRPRHNSLPARPTRGTYTRALLTRPPFCPRQRAGKGFPAENLPGFFPGQALTVLEARHPPRHAPELRVLGRSLPQGANIFMRGWGRGGGAHFSPRSAFATRSPAACLLGARGPLFHPPCSKPPAIFLPSHHHLLLPSLTSPPSCSFTPLLPPPFPHHHHPRPPPATSSLPRSPHVPPRSLITSSCNSTPPHSSHTPCTCDACREEKRSLQTKDYAVNR